MKGRHRRPAGLPIKGLTVLAITKPDLERDVRAMAVYLALCSATGHRPPGCPQAGPVVSVLYLAAATPPVAITEMIGTIASGHAFPPPEGWLTVRDAPKPALWQPRGLVRLHRLDRRDARRDDDRGHRAGRHGEPRARAPR